MEVGAPVLQNTFDWQSFNIGEQTLKWYLESLAAKYQSVIAAGYIDVAIHYFAAASTDTSCCQRWIRIALVGGFQTLFKVPPNDSTM